MKQYMKKLFFVTALMAVVFTSCVNEDFDKPDVIIPEYDGASNTTIADLKATYPGTLDSIETVTIIEGVVVANDESGNFYKTIVIQDATGGIELKLDRYDMYTAFKVGQRVFVECQGLFLGDYGGLVQIGYIYNGAIGRIPDVLIDSHVYRDSLPGNAPAAAVVTIPTITPANLSTLIQLDEVHFTEPGLAFSETSGTTNRTLADANGNQILVRTSNYASFAADIIPDGVGSVRGILSIFNGDYQLYIRDMNDIVNWYDPNANSVIYDPFNIDPLVNSGWTMYSAAGNKDWYYNSAYKDMAVTASGSDAACNDYLITPAISLSGVANPVLTFSSWTNYADAGMATPIEVLVSTDYSGSGDPTTATWTALSATWSPTGSTTYTPSGNISLTSYSGQTVYIAFHYRSSGNTSGNYSAWKIDDFKIEK